MSFGRPPNFTTFSVTPPDRGSFPLDHDGECKSVMLQYLKCIKENKNDNGKCRHLSKDYLQCRMDRGLMEKDEMSNLGFHPEDSDTHNNNQQSPPPQDITSSPTSRMV